MNSETSIQTEQAGGKVVDSEVILTDIQEVREQQSLARGIIGGSVAAVIGAGLWALITVIIQYQIGWMAVGVGFLVGYGVRIMGKGADNAFGVTGAILALLGCIGGNILTGLYFVCGKYGFPVEALNIMILVKIMSKTFSPMDVVFYALAVYEGFKFSIVKRS